MILPLYPHFSISTSGSALRVLERMLYTTPGFPMKSTVVPSWFNRKGCAPALPPATHLPPDSHPPDTHPPDFRQIPTRQTSTRQNPTRHS